MCLPFSLFWKIPPSASTSSYHVFISAQRQYGKVRPWLTSWLNNCTLNWADKMDACENESEGWTTYISTDSMQEFTLQTHQQRDTFSLHHKIQCASVLKSPFLAPVERLHHKNSSIMLFLWCNYAAAARKLHRGRRIHKNKVRFKLTFNPRSLLLKGRFGDHQVG